MKKLLIAVCLFCASFSWAVPLKKVFGVGQAEYHRMVYAKTWAWLKVQKKIVSANQDEKKFLSLIDHCLSQVPSFSEILKDDIDINYLRVVLAKDSSQVQLYCPDSILGQQRKLYVDWFNKKSWSGDFWVWEIEKKQIENFKLIHELPKQVDLNILGHVQKGFELAPFFFQSSSSKRLIFLKPASEKEKFQVHPFADPDRYVLLNEAAQSLEYSTRMLVIENHPEVIKKLVYKLIDEFGIIPDRMFSTQNSLGLVVP